jgi:malonyl-CoA/methylmalonyl-CoA synthetase
VPPKLELFTRAVQFAQQERIAVITNGKQYTYDDLLQDSFHIASILSARDLQEERVAFLMPANYQYVKTQWAIWLAGGIAVPLSPLHPPAEWEYFIRDSESSIVVTSSEYSKDIAPVAQKLNRRLVTLNANKTFTDTQPHFNTSLREFVDIEPHRGAQIIYTSGTTSRPKGVLSTHANVSAQVRTLVHSWEWSAKDHILNVLPLHHIHGIINVVTCALWSGAKLEMMENFDARKVWDVFIRDSVKQRGLVSSFLRSSPQGVTLFMAVPPIYSRLIKEYETMSAAEQKAATEACRRLRLMVSGSMALPQSVFRRWEEISGHQLLERYGMTEIGMALSNPIRGPRLPGRVGTPLPNVQVKIQPIDSSAPNDSQAPLIGELLVKGPQVFREYWRRPEETKAAFDAEGWFKTGDIVEYHEGTYRILGRTTVDILKTGGYKVSALEVEQTLVTHPAIAECAVVGIPDNEFGQVVGVVASLKSGERVSLEELQKWAKKVMAPYKIPRRLVVVDSIPRNAMGKINKKELVNLFD